MNATPDTPALTSLSSAGLTDVWGQAYPNQLGYTWPSAGPDKRIDYCWASEAYSTQVQSVSLAAISKPTDVVYASDHLALVTQFDI